MYARPIRNLSRCWSFAGLLLFGVATSQQASAANPHDYDIRGMKLGQTVEEIKASMAKLIPGATVHEEFWIEEPGFEKAIKTLWIGVGENAKYNYNRFGFQVMEEYIQATFSSTTGRAYLVVRRIGSQAKEKVIIDNLVAALIDKYGQPSYRNNLNFGWYFKENGEPNNKCEILIFTGDPGKPNPGCGVSLSATISQDSSNLIANWYAFSLYDHAAALNDKKERDARKQEQKRRKEMETVKEHQGNVPKL